MIQNPDMCSFSRRDVFCAVIYLAAAIIQRAATASGRHHRSLIGADIRRKTGHHFHAGSFPYFPTARSHALSHHAWATISPQVSPPVQDNRRLP